MDDGNKHPVDDKKVKFKQNTIAGSKKNNFIWILTITILSFVISLILTIASSDILKEADIFTAFLVIFLIILVNIIFDIIGTAATAADETPFHAMASRKHYGAKQSIRLIRNADKVSN
ncbi:MAG: Mg2+ and Co2+ transporter CorB, partial [Bacillota bacterium]|nr:Mg2+ and Co2+ transporter CorB [Bacillota bacterium]